MRIQLLVLATLLGSCVASAPLYYPAGPSSDLAGRVAGAPQRCVPIERDYAMRPASGDPNLLVYGFGPKIWTNRLSPGCTFDASSTLVIQPVNAMSYCANDVVRSVGYGSFPGRVCILNQWVPYTRVR
jgi:hypothetical protein